MSSVRVTHRIDCKITEKSEVTHHLKTVNHLNSTEKEAG